MRTDFIRRAFALQRKGYVEELPYLRMSCAITVRVAMLPALLESHKPLDTVIIMLGTNDCKTYYHAPAEVIGKGIEKLIRQVRQADESIKILLISPILLGEEVWKSQFDPEFDTELKAVYQKIAIEQGTDFLAASDYAKPSPIDQEHLDEEGHRRLAEAVYHKLAKMQLGTGAA